VECRIDTVCPRHRDLDYPAALELQASEQLNIKSKTGSPALNHRAGDSPTLKKFETALGVTNTFDQGASQDTESCAAKAAPELLAADKCRAG
jgi:hypothetical protein